MRRNDDRADIEAQISTLKEKREEFARGARAIPRYENPAAEIAKAVCRDLVVVTDALTVALKEIERLRSELDEVRNRR